jgi:hypothetical protein
VIRDLLYHALVGNDTHPVLVATARALVGAALTGAISFFGIWQTTDEVKVLVTAGVLPFLTYIAARIGVEVPIDIWKARNGA